MLSSCTSNVLRTNLQQRLYSTADKVSSIFSSPNAAQFLGCIGSSQALPYLHGLPEIVVTGRANVGKSSLLNALIGRNSLMRTSKKAARTRQVQFFRVGREPGKLIVVDTPGYGSRGRREWGDAFDHYIQNRKELRRIYILFNAKHPVHEVDSQMLTHLSEFLLTSRGTQPFTLQSIITKADAVPADKLENIINKIKEDIWTATPLCLPPIITSSTLSFGIEQLRENIAKVCALV